MTVLQRQHLSSSILDSKISSAEVKQEKQFLTELVSFACVRNKT